MTWQEKRVVTILSTILLILSAALLIVGLKRGDLEWREMIRKRNYLR